MRNGVGQAPAVVCEHQSRPGNNALQTLLAPLTHSSAQNSTLLSSYILTYLCRLHTQIHKNILCIYALVYYPSTSHLLGLWFGNVFAM